MKADRVGQVWEVGRRVYLVVRVQEENENRVIYDGLILHDALGGLDDVGIMRNLVEYGEGQWEKLIVQTRLA